MSTLDLTTLRRALLVLASASLAGAETIALVGGTVHPVSKSAIREATVVIEDGRIVAVGAGIVPPAGATVVSVAGKHLYPG
jgi:imidazolonepropionase-like amidohydrolase